MIENESCLSKDDLRFIMRDTRRQPRVILSLIVLTVAGVMAFGGGVLLLVLGLLYHNWSQWLIIIVGILMGGYALISVIFRTPLAVSKAMKQPQYQAPRHFLADESGITVETQLKGLEAKNVFSYDLAEMYKAEEGVLYVRIKLEKKGYYYLCIHDDGYKQGDRAALVSLLESHHIPQQ